MDDRALAELEAQTRFLLAGALRAHLDSLTRTVTAVYVAAAGDTRHALPGYAQNTLRAALSTVLREMADQQYTAHRGTLLDAARAALSGGADDYGVTVKATLPWDVRQAFTGFTAGMREDLRTAAHLVRTAPLGRYGDLLSVLTTARRAVNRAEAMAVYTVHQAHNDGRLRAVRRLWSYGDDVWMLWRAERGACIACLGYAGDLTRPGDPFAPVFAVADVSATPAGPIWGPPLHPYCRCAVEAWRGHGPDELDPLDLPHALRREAQRSVLGGQAQGSNPARLRAADRLLDAAGLLVPKTVQKRARRAVDAGAFPG